MYQISGRLVSCRTHPTYLSLHVRLPSLIRQAGQCDPTHIRVYGELSALNISLSRKDYKHPSTDTVEVRTLAPFILLEPCRVCNCDVTHPRDGLHRRRTSGMGGGGSQVITAFPQSIPHTQLIGLHSSVVPKEGLALIASFSRLARRPCRWRRCTAVLNSLGSLLVHIHRFHVSYEAKLCEWDGCRKRLGEQQAFTMIKGFPRLILWPKHSDQIWCD
ncbi:hypothetical protein R3P38DRAFT_1459329 [Favolaschia claudopus]|uniref:C2H2-type domain-containing protein n=1 Tax=Favolaschia claudopus TaxID=2862362 RepID=A0AAW0ALW7_9AGAR